MKRLLVFLVLLTGGFMLLYQLIGEELFGATVETENEPAPRPSPTMSRTNIGVRQGALGATGEQRGELRFPKVREIPQPDGSVLKETVFVLHAEDSQPLRNGLQQLDRVEVTLFDDGKSAAIIQAERALVELGRDANGNASLVSDKEISMSNAVFSALPGSRLEGLRLELDRARALVDETEIHLYTPSDDDPVLLTFDGERRVRLEGQGLQARLPRDRNGTLQRVTVEILRQPIVTTAGATARARGRLHYTEDLGRDTAQLTLADDVVLELDRGSRSAAAPGSDRDTVRATGDQLLGWLSRSSRTAARQPGNEEGAWRMLQLSGAPATVEMAELRVKTPRLDVLPGLFGSPFWITASGGHSEVEELATPGHKIENRTPIHGHSPHGIHLWQTGEHLGAMHRAFGFPQWTLAPLSGMRVVAFDGNSRIEDQQRSVSASDGIHVFHPDARRNGVIARGFGDARLLQSETTDGRALRANGNDGFRLIAGIGRELFDLGPSHGASGWQTHQYELQHGELAASGAGACHVERDDQHTIVFLQAPGNEIEAQLAKRDAQLTNVRQLRARLEGEDVVAFELAGIPAMATLVRDTETIVAAAPRIEQTDRASLRMLPPGPTGEIWHDLQEGDSLPRLRRSAAATAERGKQELTTTAPWIDLHHVGADQLLVDARADTKNVAHIEATVSERPGADPVHVALDAMRLRALPFVLSPQAARFHAGGSGPAALLPFTTWGRPWILGNEVHQIRLEDPDQGTFEGEAHRLTLSTAAEAGLLIGNPDTLTSARATRHSDGRVVTASGAQVRISRNDRGRLQAFRAYPGRSTFVLPEIERHSDSDDGVLAHAIATCRGDIEVLPDAVLFGGPVVARSVDADGSTQPDGLGIVANQLRMELHPETGEVLRVFGHDVELDWPRVRGRAAEIELQLRWNRCIARDPEGARVVLANGLVVTGERVTVDYHTLAFDAYRGRIEPQAEDRAVPR